MIGDPVARILVVDDEIPLVHALQGTLEQHGYSVTGTNRSDDALRLLKQQRFDLLLSDLNLPGIDGIELLRAALEIDPQMIGIIMTGHGTVDTAVEAMKVGALDYVLKPFKLSAVLAVLARALTVRRLRLENVALQHHLEARTSELEAANRELEAFTYSASHDLRGPIRSIAGFSQAILEALDQGELDAARDAARRIHARTERMHRLTEDLLRLARVARADLNVTEIDLAEIAREVFGKLQSEHPERRVNVEIAPTLKASGDPGMLRVALENLIANAWKYSGPSPHPKIEIGVEALDGQTPVFFVRDNGVGFDPKRAHRLFVPFERLHPETQFPGTGIGLSTVQRIILKHGGRVWAEATPNVGATFRFTLPSPPPSPGASGGVELPPKDRTAPPAMRPSGGPPQA